MIAGNHNTLELIYRSLLGGRKWTDAAAPAFPISPKQTTLAMPSQLPHLSCVSVDKYLLCLCPMTAAVRDCCHSLAARPYIRVCRWGWCVVLVWQGSSRLSINTLPSHTWSLFPILHVTWWLDPWRMTRVSLCVGAWASSVISDAYTPLLVADLVLGCVCLCVCLSIWVSVWYVSQLRSLDGEFQPLDVLGNECCWFQRMTDWLTEIVVTVNREVDL